MGDNKRKGCEPPMKQSAQERLEHWKNRIRHQQDSGLSQRSWCQQEGIKYDLFCYWKKQVKRKGNLLDHASSQREQLAKGSINWIEVDKPLPSATQSIKAPVPSKPAPSESAASPMEVQIGPYLLRFPQRFDRESFRAACEELRRLC